MTIDFKTGNIFSSEADYLVNTVNCEGYMGKGIAFQFKQMFPKMEKEYKKICELGELKPGRLHFYQENNKTIINFPTKNKWREKSKIQYIEQGLIELRREILKRNIMSIAIPPLGSGNGGLNWNDVKKLILHYLDDISSEVVIEVFEPASSVEKNKLEPKSNFKTLYILYISERVMPPKLVKLKNALQLIEIRSNKSIKISNFEQESDTIVNLKKYYGIQSNNELYSLIRTKLISDSIESLEKTFQPFADEAILIVNKYDESTTDCIIKALDLIANRKIDYFKNEVPSEIVSIMFSEQLLVEDIFGNITLK